MAFWGFGPAELLLLLVVGGAGQSADLVSMVPPEEYFKGRDIEISVGKMMELAGTAPKTSQAQIAQLLALRWLAERTGDVKKNDSYAAHVKTLEEIAAGKKAADRLGFAKEYAERTLRRWSGAKPPVEDYKGGRDDGLAWFPAGATIVGSLDGRIAPASMPAKNTFPELFKMIPAEVKKEIFKTLDGLGNVQVDRVSFGYAQASGEIFVRVTGKLQQDWVVDFAKKSIPGIPEIKTRKGPKNQDISQFHMDRSAALALVGDTDLLICGLVKGQVNSAEVIDTVLAVRDGKKASVLTGAIKGELKKVPAKAVGLMVGAVPDEVRRDMERGAGAAPRSILAFIERTATGLDFQLEGRFDNDEGAKSFVGSVSKGRKEALDSLKMAAGNVPPGIDLEGIRNVLESFQIEAKGSAANMRVLVPSGTLQTLPSMFLYRAGAAAVPPPPPMK